MRRFAFALLLAVAALPAAASPQAVRPADTPVGAEEACRALEVQTSGLTAFHLTPLNQLPPGALQRAVLRMVGGCPVAEMSFAGHTYYAVTGPPRSWDGPATQRPDTVPRVPKQH